MKLMIRLCNAIPFSKVLVSCIRWLARGIRQSASLKTARKTLRRILVSLDCFHIFHPIDRLSVRLAAFPEPNPVVGEELKAQKTGMQGGRQALANIYKRKIAANNYPPDNASTRQTKQGNVNRLNAAEYPCTVQDSWKVIYELTVKDLEDVRFA